MKIRSKKSAIIIVLTIVVIAGLSLTVFRDSIEERIAAVQGEEPAASDMIEAYTAGKKDIRLTIGMLKSDEQNFMVFGTDSRVLEPKAYEYEIGSISKTLTASILCKAISEGKINLDDPISAYLPLDTDIFYPTVKRLVTHTSGYGEYPFSPSELSEKEMKTVSNDFYKKKLNIYRGIDRADTLAMIEKHPLKNQAYGWEYSNFGIAALGTVLGDVYHTSFQSLAEDYINDLGLAETRIGNGEGNLANYWTWDDGDAFIAAGGFVSTVTDLLNYGRMHLKDSPDYLALSHQASQSFQNGELSMGLGWIIDPETGYLWHNGGTSSYTSFLGIDKKSGTVVVILSNDSAGEDSEDGDALDILGYTLLDRLSREGVDVYNALE
jgi:CubicO group peptidase (beta-lactamase class C family)